MTPLTLHNAICKTWLRNAALVGTSLACSWALAQKIDDVPPAVKNNVSPNFMFMIDNSGSMSNIVPAGPYSDTTIYLASCSSAQTIATSSQVGINISSAGTPRFDAGGTRYRHTTDTSSSSDPRRCFNPAGIYTAALLGVPETPGSYLPAQYSGNYLNWYFGTYAAPNNHPLTLWINGRKRLAIASTGAVETRIEIARTAASSVIDSLPLPATSTARAPVRVGLSTYRSDDGGGLRIEVGDLNSAKATAMKDSISTLVPSGNTPLATTLADIGRYFSSGYNGNVTAVDITGTTIVSNVPIIDFLKQDTRQSCLNVSSPGSSCTSQASLTVAQRPIQNWCQRSSVFMLTDGRPTADNRFANNNYLKDYDGDCSGSFAANCSSGGGSDRKNAGLRTYENSTSSDYMDDVAKALFDVDLRPDLTKPNPVAPALRAKNNLTTYMIGFADLAVRNDPLLNNTAIQGGGKFISASDGPQLVSAFKEIIADALDKDASAAAVAVTNTQVTAGTVGYSSSYSSGNWLGDLEAYSLDISTGLQTGPAQWSARDKLSVRTSSDRKIASFNGTAGVAFTTANGTTFRTNVSTLTDGLINYFRGVRTGEGTTYRSRDGLLGDIINAEPVVVSYPTTGATVFQAANDGMLHVFDGRVSASATTRGQELWAYVPRLIHDKLPGLASTTFEHKFLIDSTPSVASITGMGAMTRILVGGLGKGGAGYYALDITTGTASTEADAVSKAKWEFKPSNMGYSFGVPLIVNTASGWKVVVASGYRNDTATGGLSGDGRGRVWVLNPSTGSIEKTFTTPTGFGSATDSLGLAHLGKLANTAADVQVQYVYGGDLKGNVWRFDLTAADGSDAVRIAALKAPDGTSQPVSVPPVVGPVAGSSSKVYIYLGTGQYFSDDDVPGSSTPNAFATQRQTMYGIVDDTSVATPTLPANRGTNGASCPTNGGDGDLVCQALTRPNTTSNFSATTNAVNLSLKRGFYVDVPVTNGRVNNQAALTAKGTLVFVVNEPTNVTCNPGGNSFFFQLSATTGGAVARVLGGNTYFDAGFALADALSSRAVLITTATGARGVFRLTNKTTQSLTINETEIGSAVFKRIYKRALN
jgi:type IV pilus assembly protein PilY1